MNSRSLSVVAVAAVLVTVALGACGTPGPAGAVDASAADGESVLDLTWGWGWNRTDGGQTYGDASPTERAAMREYYRSRVRMEDASGRPVAPVEQVAFDDEAASNAPTGEAPPAAGFIDRLGRPVSLDDWKGKKNVLLVFTRGYPGYVCPLCTSYTAQLAYRYADIVATGTEVLLVFPGEPAKVDDFIRAARAILDRDGAEALPFPVLMDVDLEHVDDFGIAADLARPSTYLIDRQGIVRYAYVGTQPHERPSVDRLLEELRRLDGGR